VKNNKKLCFFLFIFASCMLLTNSYAAKSLDYYAKPPFSGQDIKPNVIVAMDISGSMKLPAYSQKNVNWSRGLHTNFDKTKSYFGYFNKDIDYIYDVSKGFFRAPIAGETGDWSGNFLNWVAMRRIDTARKVMVGGKVSVKTLDQDTSSPTFNENVLINRHKASEWSNWRSTWDGYWVIEGNNEPEDRRIRKKYTLNMTDGLTPAAFNDGTEFWVRDGQIIPQVLIGSTVVLEDDQTGHSPLETGSVPVEWDNTTKDWTEVEFVNAYTDPVVVVKSVSEKDGAPVVVRVKDVNTNLSNGKKGFLVRLQAWDYDSDQNHNEEVVMYVVAESGNHNVALDGGGTLEYAARKVLNNRCGSSNFSTLPFGHIFASPPVVFTSVSTFDDPEAVITRNKSITTTAFDYVMQEQQLNSYTNCNHGTEEISVIAIMPVSGTTQNTQQQVEIGTQTRVSHKWKKVSLATTFASTVQVVTDMQTTNGGDPCNLRHNFIDESSFKLHVDEEQSDDNEVKHEGLETIGYLATIGNTAYNIRVGVKDEPVGLLQDIAPSMRIGLAVYNYDHTKAPSKIYKGNTVHGGNMHPAFPDIKKLPADRTNYDISLSTGVHDPVKNIYRVIEEHPLIWGSTPIAETLYEIKNYLQQKDASGDGFYADKSTNPTYPSGALGGPQDPYYYSEFGGLVYCADTFILHFNDGEPFRDFDGSGHPTDITGDGIGATGLNEELDDLAWDLRYYDLRTDTGMDERQEAVTYYVYAALGESEMFSSTSRKMRESAVNGGFIDSNDDHKPDPRHDIGGAYSDINNYIKAHETPSGSGVYSCSTNEWDSDGDCNPDTFYLANDGYQLVTELTKAFASILQRSSSGTAASVVSSSRSGEGAVYQSVFFPGYKDAEGSAINWVGEVRALMVDAYGHMRTDMYLNPVPGATNCISELGAGSLCISRDTVHGPKQVNTRNEDLNYNGTRDVDEPDYDGDGKLDYRDLIVVFKDGKINFWDDVNENGVLDDEDQVTFSPDIPGWHGNGVLDFEQDADGDGVPSASEDINHNGVLDTEDLNGSGGVTPDSELVIAGVDTKLLDFLWNSKDWLDDVSLNPLLQRSTYDTAPVANSYRYIFTFVDKNKNMIADAGEVMDFISDLPEPTLAAIKNTDKIYPYLTLYPSFDDKPQWVKDLEILDTANGNTTFKDELLRKQTRRLIEYVRGADQPALTIGGLTDIVPAMRSRQYQTEVGGNHYTWRLGDIVSSSPTLVGRPAEGYHLLYRDESYAYFLARYLNRRSVIYAGANDGMIHAFNGGFYKNDTKEFVTQVGEPFIDSNNNGTRDAGERYSDLNGDGSYTPANQTNFALGEELWAYIPFNQLTHLYWMSEKDYPHVYYNDLTPKIFDAKIFAEDVDHPKGWGTVMVVGMKFGGGQIYADTNKDDIVDITANASGHIDQQMNSAFVVFDITNPEVAPKVLAEITLPEQGFTTCFPTVLPMRKKTGSGNSVSFGGNDWYLAFGSGPADVNGVAASRDVAGQVALSGTIGDISVIDEGRSKQNGKFYVVNLRALTGIDDTGFPVNLPKRVEVIDTAGAPLVVDATTTHAFIEEFSDISFISQPVTVDMDLDFNADVVYFGSIIWDSANSAWGGKLKRLIIDDSLTTTDWVSSLDFGAGVVDRADNVLLDLTLAGINGINQPITTAPTVTVGAGTGFNRERWVFFGTGRYLVGGDTTDSSPQSYYGIKEPYMIGAGSLKTFTWTEVVANQLLNSTNILVYNDGTVEGHPVVGGSPVTTWDDMIDAMEGPTSTFDGWLIDFTETNERNLGQAALLGGLLTFTTYTPSPDICKAEGTSALYARWYETGTSFYRKVFQDGNTFVDRNGDNVIDHGELVISGRITLGKGMALTPNIHTGREEGSKAYVQTSEGDIVSVEQGVVGDNKSQKTSWMQRR